MVFDATDKILGRLASKVAKEMISARKSGRQQRVIIINAEDAIVSGPRTKVLSDYRAKYKLNHARKGPFFPRMPDKIIKRTVRGMLPYQKNSSRRRAAGHNSSIAVRSVGRAAPRSICLGRAGRCL